MKYYGLLVLISILIFASAFYLSDKNNSDFVNYTIKHIRSDIQNTFVPLKPCAQPIPYSLGFFDPRFGISTTTFLADVSGAAGVWNKIEGKKLFEFSSSTEGFSVNLLYDDRQQTTNLLNAKKTDIGGGKAEYSAVKAKYDSLKNSYASAKSAYDKLLEEVNAEQENYNRQVNQWNKKGGAPENEYSKLEQQRASLNSLISQLNAARSSLNSLADQINTTVATLNGLAQDVNAQVQTYNSVVRQTGEEFNEGEYIVDESGERINIYQFDTKEKLVRLLEHELGHALGLDHVSDPNAIMYRLNSGKGTALTADDIKELQKICKGN